MEMSIYKREVNQLCSMIDHHPHRLVDPSPWPLLGSMGALTSTIGSVMYMHYFTGGGTLLSLGLGMILYTMFVWWRDVIRESTYEGHHTFVVQLGLRYGMILFIVSEVMFFLAFFWAFFHSSLALTWESNCLCRQYHALLHYKKSPSKTLWRV